MNRTPDASAGTILAILVLVAPPEVRAAETGPGDPLPMSDTPKVSAPAVPVMGQLKLTKGGGSGATEPNRRTHYRSLARAGSFLWVAGAIVVAGVILAVLV